MVFTLNYLFHDHNLMYHRTHSRPHSHYLKYHPQTTFKAAQGVRGVRVTRPFPLVPFRAPTQFFQLTKPQILHQVQILLQTLH